MFDVAFKAPFLLILRHVLHLLIEARGVVEACLSCEILRLDLHGLRLDNGVLQGGNLLECATTPVILAWQADASHEKSSASFEWVGRESFRRPS